MNYDLDNKNLELNLLLDQRNILVESNRVNNNNMMKIIVALLPEIILIVLTFIFNVSNGPLIRLSAFELMLILSLSVFAFLVNMNVFRDYISAIDKYLYEKYDISSLIFEGELSKKHLTGIKGLFPELTTLIALSVVTCGVILFSFIIKTDLSYYISNKIYFVFLSLIGIQVLIFIILGLKNIKRKAGKDDSILNDCYEYISRTKKEE